METFVFAFLIYENGLASTTNEYMYCELDATPACNVMGKMQRAMSAIHVSNQ